MSTYFLLVRENRIAQEPSCSPSKSVGNCLGNILSEHILDAHRIFWKQDLLHDGKASQTIPRGRVRQGDTFFGLSKPDIPGDKLGFRPLSVRPVHSEQSLSTTSRYTRGTNGWASTSSTQTCISSKLGLWAIYCIPCYRIFTFLVLGVMLTHLVILWSMFW